MSVQALAWVFDHSTARGADRLVLLALANHAGKEPVNGAWECWPGVATIAREAGLERHRTAQDALTRLEGAGAIERVLNGAPDGRIRPDRRPNLYRILGVSQSDTPTGDGTQRGDVDRQGAPRERGVVSRPNGVSLDDRSGCRFATPKPSMNRQGTGAGEAVASPEAVRAAVELAKAKLVEAKKGNDGDGLPGGSQDAHESVTA